MGAMAGVMNVLFGSGRNLITETAQVFRENRENAGVRAATEKSEVMRQFAAEFAHPRRGWFDRFVDGLNRLPRPLMALGTLALFGAAMYDPLWFAARMQGLALVPEPLLWLMGAIVGFYFGARHQAKGQEFQSSIAETMALTSAITDNIRTLETQGSAATPDPETAQTAWAFSTENAALKEWQVQYGS